MLEREDGYLIGFNASGEGWNGEYPFVDNNLKPEEDADWLQKRAEAIEARGPATPPASSPTSA